MLSAPYGSSTVCAEGAYPIALPHWIQEREAQVPSYRVVYKSGEAFAVGRSKQEANEIAQHVANLLGKSVWILSELSDVGTEVPPDRCRKT